jgi:hypothetical protein
MGDIVNLRRFKKSKSREEDAREAEANRRKFGQTKVEKEQRAAQETLEARKLDGHKIDE